MKLALFALCGLAASSVALAAPPAAPQISVAATDIKQLQFDWASVPTTNRYELWFKANSGAQWVKYAETPAQRPRFRISVSVHLLDWQTARYQVKACNPSGCSASNEVGVDGQQRAAMGYFKPNVRADAEWVTYGGNPALSADGNTFVTVDGEPVNATTSTAVLYVYRKTTASSGWRLEARLKPRVRQNTSDPYIGDQLAISGDGNLIAYGAWTEVTTGAEPQNAGTIYLFRRSGSTWTPAQEIRGGADMRQYFGYLVKLDDAGQTLVVSHQEVGDSWEPGTLEIYRVNASNQFTHRATVRVPVVNGTPATCDTSIALSGDGNTLMRLCSPTPQARAYLQVFDTHTLVETSRVDGGSADGVESSYDGTHILVQNEADAIAYDLTSSGWVSSGLLGTFGGSAFNATRHIALSRDGKIAALGSPSDVALGRGPIFPPYQTADHETGGVIIHERRASGWVVRRLIKPDTENDGWFGYSVALGDNGKVLAVGAPLDASAATGIDGDRDDDSALNRGAAWLY
jgi:hypothetical protein